MSSFSSCRASHHHHHQQNNYCRKLAHVPVLHAAACHCHWFSSCSCALYVFMSSIRSWNVLFVKHKKKKENVTSCLPHIDYVKTSQPEQTIHTTNTKKVGKEREKEKKMWVSKRTEAKKRKEKWIIKRKDEKSLYFGSWARYSLECGHAGEEECAMAGKCNQSLNRHFFPLPSISFDSHSCIAFKRAISFFLAITQPSTTSCYRASTKLEKFIFKSETIENNVVLTWFFAVVVLEKEKKRRNWVED